MSTVFRIFNRGSSHVASLVSSRRLIHGILGTPFIELPIYPTYPLPKSAECTFNDKQIHIRYNEIENEGFYEWDNLKEIGVTTTDKGPWDCDAFWRLQFTNPDYVLFIESENHIFKELIGFFAQKYDKTFDMEQVVDSMGYIDNNYFKCWPT